MLTHPLLDGLRRPELRRWAQVADEVELEPGDVLLHEDRIGNWFFLIDSGTATRTRAGVVLGELGPGDHVGAVAILGLGPQPATIVATTTVRAFVVGRRHFLALVHDMAAIQRRLFPDLGVGGLPAKLRELRAAASIEWKAVAAARPKPATPARGMSNFHRPPGRLTRTGAVTWPALPGALFTLRPPAIPPVQPLSRRTRVVLALSALLLLALAAWAYHPPMIVVRPLGAIDVSRDIAISGVPVHPIHGRYLLLTVKLERPNVFGALRAVIAHDRRLPARSGQSQFWPTGSPNSFEAFRKSQQAAAAAAASAAGFDVKLGGEGAVVDDSLDHGGPDGLRPGDVIVAVDHRPVAIAPDVSRLAAERPPGAVSTLTVERDGDRVEASLSRTSDEVRTGRLRLMLDTRNATFSMPFRVTFRRRPIGGPSGGLIYALALSDMLGAGDLAHGRTIAATGTIDPSGEVTSVGFVADKSASVRRAHATELLVPTNQVIDGARSGRPVRGVLTLDEAIQSLASEP